jgi:hypothetical protein
MLNNAWRRTAVADQGVANGLKCVKSAGRIDERCAGVDHVRDAERFGDLLFCHAQLPSLDGMRRVAAVAPQADRGRGGDKLAKFASRRAVVTPELLSAT